MFTKKNVFEKCGCFDTEYKIFSDFDWLLRCIIQHKINISKMNIPIAYYLMGGVSEKHIKKFMYEKYEIIAKYTGLNHLLRYSLSHPFLFSEYMMYIISNRLSRHLKAYISTSNQKRGMKKLRFVSEFSDLKLSQNDYSDPTFGRLT